ncbi:MAG: CoA-transferase subunit beta [Candidatus Geothermarchaeales archaeon]
MSEGSVSHYTPEEIMVAAAAREIRDGEKVLVGIGLPTLAALLAQRTHAPRLVMIYESGVVGARPSRLALTMGDPALASGASMVTSFFDGFALFLQRGHINVAFLGGAQIDKRGNLNSTVIGDYSKPKVRLPGSGGACESASLADRVVVILPHEKRRFVEKVDFVTSSGHPVGAGSRSEYGLRGGGPATVVSTLGVLGFDGSGEMYLKSYHPGRSVEEVRDNTSWDLKVSADVRETSFPTDEELRILREELDPKGMFLDRP